MIRFSVFEIDLDAGELRKQGVKLKLQDQPFQVLTVLLSRPGEVVPREELQKKLWPDGTFVDFEHGVNTAVKKLREIFGDDADRPRFIETVPRRGYRFIAPVEAIPLASAELSRRGAMQVLHGVYLASTVIIVMLVVGITAWWSWRTNHVGPQIPRTKQLTFSGKVGAAYFTEALQSIQTDGYRLYYVDKDNHLRFVPANGGDEGYIRSDASGIVLLHISPDGSTLLVREWTGSTGVSESPLWLVPVNGGPRQRLGDIEAQDAAWSTDGRTIAFAQGSSLFLADPTGNHARKLATLPGRPFWLRWSPDGKSLRFTVFDPTRGARRLWQADLSGAPRELLGNGELGENSCCGVWSPDGRNYLFLKFSEGQSQLWAIPTRRFGLGDLRPVPVGVMPIGVQVISIASHPSQRKLFLMGLNPTTETYFVRPSDKRLIQLFPQSSFSSLRFSRDGKWVVLLSHAAGGLWRARADGTDQIQLTSRPLLVVDSVFSQDSSRIAIVGKFPDQPYKVYWVSTEGGALHELPTDVTNQVDPNWTLDGESIIFGEPPHFWAESGKQKAIYISNLKAGRTTRIPGSEGWFSPRISPDGRLLATMSLDLKGLGVFDFDTANWRSLPQPNGPHNHFWSSDGNWIYYNNLNGEVRRLLVKNGHTELVLSIPELLPTVSCFADGFTPEQALILACTRETSDLYALDWD